MSTDLLTCMDTRWPGADMAPGSGPPSVDGAGVDSFAEAIGRQDAERALALCRAWQARHGAGTGDVYFGLVLPSIRQLERRWRDERIAYEQLVPAFLTLHRVLRGSVEQRPRPSPSGARGRVALALVDGAAHEFGLLVVADAFQAEGWRVDLFTGPTRETLLSALSATSFDLLGISVGNDRELPLAARLADAARRHALNPSLKIVVGGCVIAPPREQYGFLGVDHIAYDAQDALVFAEALRTGAPRAPEDPV